MKSTFSVHLKAAGVHLISQKKRKNLSLFLYLFLDLVGERHLTKKRTQDGTKKNQNIVINALPEFISLFYKSTTTDI